MNTPFINKLYKLPFEKVLEISFYFYAKNSNDAKLINIYNRIMSSNHVSGLIVKSNFYNEIPSEKDFLICLNHIPYFFISNTVKTAIAALMALQRWNEEVNEHKMLITENELHYRAMNILEISKAIDYLFILKLQ